MYIYQGKRFLMMIWKKENVTEITDDMDGGRITHHTRSIALLKE